MSHGHPGLRQQAVPGELKGTASMKGILPFSKSGYLKGAYVQFGNLFLLRPISSAFLCRCPKSMHTFLPTLMSNRRVHIASLKRVFSYELWGWSSIPSPGFRATVSNPNGLLSQKLCPYLDQSRTLNDIFLRAAY